MTSRDFCFWLQGFLELRDPKGDAQNRQDLFLSAEQVACVKSHLALVFKHEIDPSMGPAKHQAALDIIHNPQPPHGLPTMRC